MKNKINYKSDFDFILQLKDCAGNLIGWPDYDWTAKFYTSQKVNAFVASCKGGECVNCYNDNGQIHIVANDHKLSAGVLNVEFTAEIPSGVYPDDSERIVVPLPLDIELIRAAAPCPESFEVEVLLPYIKGDKGDPFTFEDFTPEQIEVLQHPALEAAKNAKKATDTVISDMQTKSEEWGEAERQRVEAESARVTAEKTRAANETTRGNNESIRKANERQRVTDEGKRTSAETLRENAESARQKAEGQRNEAEQQRATEFAGFASTISNKADRTELSNVYGEPTSAETEKEFEARTGFTREDMKKDLFIDLWNQACGSYGKYNAATGFFELNGLTDITYKQALGIMLAYKSSQQILAQTLTYLQSRVRTTIPIYLMPRLADSNNGLFDSSTVEVVRLHTGRTLLLFASNFNRPFDRCLRIRRWEDVIDWFSNSVYGNSNKHTFIFDAYNWYHDNHPFEYFRFKNVNFNVNCQNYENIGIDSFQYLIDNRWPLSTDYANPFNVIVHPKVYAKLTGDTTNEAYNSLTEEEKAQWTSLVASAQEKQITFVTI